MPRRPKCKPVPPEEIDLDDLAQQAMTLGLDPAETDILNSPRMWAIYGYYGYVSKLDWEAACRKRPEIADTIRRAAASGVLARRRKMDDLLFDKDNAQAGIFMLKGTDPGMFGDKRELTVSQALTIKNPLSERTDEELQAIIAAGVGLPEDDEGGED